MGHLEKVCTRLRYISSSGRPSIVSVPKHQTMFGRVLAKTVLALYLSIGLLAKSHLFCQNNLYRPKQSLLADIYSVGNQFPSHWDRVAISGPAPSPCLTCSVTFLSAQQQSEVLLHEVEVHQNVTVLAKQCSIGQKKMFWPIEGMFDEMFGFGQHSAFHKIN